MRDLNEDSSSNSWPTCNGDKDIESGQQCNTGFISRTAIDGYSVPERDAMKQRMLEHETVFRSQLYELHRLYRIQKDMMEEVKRKELELHRLRFSTEPSSSSSLRGYQLTSGEAEKRLPLFDSGCIGSALGLQIGNSPMSCTKEYNMGPSQLTFVNGSNLKGNESLDSRPSKVRKRLFDLQLPSERYIGTGEMENYSENNVGLADLNKPVEIEEETAVPSSMNFLGRRSVVNGDTIVVELPEKSHESPVAVNGERNRHLPNEFWLKPGVTNEVNNGRVTHMYEAGISKRNLLIQDRLSASNSTMTGMRHHNLLPSDQIHKRSNDGHLEYPVASLPFYTSSCFSNSLAQSASSHLEPASSSAQRRAIFDSSPNSVTTVNRNLQPSSRHQVPFGENWKVNIGSSLNPNFAGGLTRNGFYRGSISGTRETQVSPLLYGLNYHVYDRDNNSYHEYQKQAIDIDLNEVVDLTSIEDERDNKPEDRLSSLPWLKSKPSHAEGAGNSKQDKFCGASSMHRSSSSQSWWKSKTGKDLNRPIPAVVTVDCELSEAKNVKKIRGVPIFETKAHDKDRSNVAPIFFHVEGIDANNEQKKRIIDINLEGEPVDDDDDDVADELEPALCKENQANDGVAKNLIDLNSCVGDSEDPSVPSFENRTATVKRILEIDLEAPPPEEDDLAAAVKEDNFSLQSLEYLKDAAEMVFSIASSYCPQNHVEDSEPLLLWFVDMVCTYSNELEDTSNEEIDDFEAMTLQLQEMEEEDYLVPQPEIQVRETNSSMLLRRGHSRRGRPRKDFRRDVLPGLSSLSRQEVTEDLQTFGGIMRAMGHHWNSTRRNGGRRRAADNLIIVEKQLDSNNNFAKALEDQSLTGWGKTTRRPRRQRCHGAGDNNAVMALLTSS